MTDNDIDQKLLADIAKGSSKSFRVLLEKYQNQVFGYCRKILEDKAMAEDIAQDTWIKIAEQAENYQPVGSVRSWILRIARNKCVDHLRSQKRWTELDDSETNQLKDEALNADELIQNFEEVSLLKQKISELPVEQRTILMMAMGENLELSEIAQQLGMSVSNVKVTLFRIRKSLREKLEGA